MTTNTLSGQVSIDVLNTGHGDMEIKFDSENPAEMQKAKETITGLLRQGYALFVKEGEETRRVRRFDAQNNVYIVGDREEVPVAEAKVTAVGRSAGG